MIIRAIAFTENGIKLLEKLETISGNDIDVIIYKNVQDVKAWTKEGFDNNEALIYVGATGIAVRMIAEHIKDKLSDSPVIVIDEAGTFVIPLVSGHVGGANRLASYIADKLNAVPVITTATDVNGAFSVDTFARENNLRIINREKIKTVSTKAIEGKPIVLSIKDYPYNEADVCITDSNIVAESNALYLSRKKYVVGIGLKKDKTLNDLEEVLFTVLSDNRISIDDVYAFASIDIKINEPGLRALSEKYRVPRIFFDKEMLNKLEGDFSASSFVKDTVGVDNVCERAALLASMPKGRLIVNKFPHNGVTIAVAERF